MSIPYFIPTKNLPEHVKSIVVNDCNDVANGLDVGTLCENFVVGEDNYKIYYSCLVDYIFYTIAKNENVVNIIPIKFSPILPNEPTKIYEEGSRVIETYMFPDGGNGMPKIILDDAHERFVIKLMEEDKELAYYEFSSNTFHTNM